MKKYINIKDASKLTGVKEHVIRYWDSLDPKTNEYRFKGISTKSKRGTRLFNKDNLSKIIQIKSLLYENGYQNHSHRLVNKILHSNSKKNTEFFEKSKKVIEYENDQKIRVILNKIRDLVK